MTLNKSILFILFFFQGVAAICQTRSIAEQKIKFDYDWKFKLGDFPMASKQDFNDADWRTLDIPHDWSIEGNFSLQNVMGNEGGYLPAGIGWYRKNFVIPASQLKKKLSIYFEGVYMNVQVYINGTLLGVHPYGYTSFFYDITPYINLGKINVIAVRVDNSQQINSRWYSGSGIYRHVWLIATDPVHIKTWGVSVTTQKVTAEMATLRIKAILQNETSSIQKVTLHSVVLDKDKKEVGKDEMQTEIPANGSKEITQNFIINSPKWWTPESPQLYEAQFTVQKEEKSVDVVTVPFGIRTIEYSAKNGFLLNGKSIKLNGGCVHHDNGIVGAAAYDCSEIRRVKLLKAAGFNAVRTSHNPPSEAFLDACDSIGLLVIDESFDCWRVSKTPYDYARYFDKWWDKDIEAMVLRDRNHPSVVFWSIGNEIIERKEHQAIETAKNLAALVHKLDSTRPVTSAMTTWDDDWEIFDSLFAVHDIGGYNYQMHHAEADHRSVPSRIIVQTESYPRDAFSNWKAVISHPYIIGDFVWTAMDYLGESGIGKYSYKNDTPSLWHGSYCGDIDLIGWRKPISHYRDLLYNEDKKLYLAVKEPNLYYGEIEETEWSVWPTWESWTWPGYEGKNIDVEVYSRYPTVRLYLNNKLVEEKQVSVDQEFKALFTLPYQPGVLKAVGVKNGKEIESQILKTAGRPVAIKLQADKAILSATGQDLAYINVEILDSEGNIQPKAENVLTFEVTGAATLIATGSANMKDIESYSSKSRKAWKGKALLVLKSKREKGSIELKVSSPGLKSSSIILTSK